MGILLMLIIAIASIACLVSFFRTPSGKSGTADSSYAEDDNDTDEDEDDDEEDDDEDDEDDDDDDEDEDEDDDDDTIRCPNCGSPAHVRGDQWECGWCGDSGFIRRG